MIINDELVLAVPNGTKPTGDQETYGMSEYDTILSKQEKNWILEQRITRLTDNKEVLIYPMGAERYLSLVLSGKKKIDITSGRILKERIY